jgi:SMP-30/Gluconolactonase/LRE-like region
MWFDKAQPANRERRRAQPKIVSVNTSDLGGGAERIATALLQRFRSRGCESWLLVGEKKTDDPYIVPFYASPYIDYRPYASPSLQEQIAAQKRANSLNGVVDWEFPYSHLIAELTGSAPDIVHLHNLHGGYFDLRAVVRLSQRFPTFVTLADNWWFSGHCAYPLGCERWRTGCGECPLLTPGAGLNPPFGANGIQFNEAGTAMFVANTANHTIIKIPMNSNGTAGTPTLFTTGINAPDGIAIDAHDNLWGDANQEDEIVVIDPSGKVIAKLGDFNGISDNGTPRGLLFPASPAFSLDGKFIYTSNFALNLPFAGAQVAIDSGWTLEVKHFTVSRLNAKIPPLGDADDGDDDHDGNH